MAEIPNLLWWSCGERVQHPDNPKQQGTIVELDDVRLRARIRWDHRIPRTWISYRRLALVPATWQGPDDETPVSV